MPTGSEQEWPLDVYRHGSRGWQKQIPKHMGSEHSLMPNATGIPKVGCIVVKRFRLKINLTSHPTDETSQPNHNKDSSRPRHKKGDEGFMEVVRRNNCILLSPKKKFRSILLKFPSVKDCIEFADQLVLLNQHLYALPHTQKDNDEPSSSASVDTNQADAATEGIQRNEVFSQIVRLVHDESFLSFTEKIEAFIKASPDGASILEALHGSGTKND